MSFGSGIREKPLMRTAARCYLEERHADWVVDREREFSIV